MEESKSPCEPAHDHNSHALRRLPVRQRNMLSWSFTHLMVTQHIQVALAWPDVVHFLIELELLAISQLCWHCPILRHHS